MNLLVNDKMDNIVLKTFNTGIKENIVSGQFINKETGFILSQGSKLFRITSDNATALIQTPDNILIQHMAFKNEQQGIIVGVPKSPGNKLNETNHTGIWLPLGSLLLIAALGFGIYKALRKWKLNFLYFLIALLVLTALYLFAPFGKNNEQKEKLFFATKGFHWFSDKPFYNRIAALTNNGGKTWKSVEIPTNFDLTGVVASNNSYYISTYASKNHKDGDIWRIDINDGDLPGIFSAKRGLSGITYQDNKIIAFGTDVVVAFVPQSRMVKTKGEILEFDEQLENLKAMDIQGEKQVNALSVLPGNIIWAIDSDGHLCKFSENKWAIENRNEISNPCKIQFLDAETGFVLSNDGKLKYTRDGGEKWTDYNMEGGTKLLDITKQSNHIGVFGTGGFVGILN